jgi:hypothetical protein
MTAAAGFDLVALHRALDDGRTARGLSWSALADEINAPFAHTDSIPIHVATIRGSARPRSVTSAVVLQILRWLGRSPESFMPATARRFGADEKLPDPGPTKILRFDTRQLHAALDQVRHERGLTWVGVAAELRGITPSMLTNLATGPLIGFPRVMTMTQWLDRPAAAFVRGRAR